MRNHGFNVGGEQSGHIILSDYTTTGDGLVAALQVLAVVKRSLDRHRQRGVPQVLRAAAAGSEEHPRIPPWQAAGRTSLSWPTAIESCARTSAGANNGRLVIRPSGTGSR
jgi:phosphoglucosamine mutase